MLEINVQLFGGRGSKSGMNNGRTASSTASSTISSTSFISLSTDTSYTELMNQADNLEFKTATGLGWANGVNPGWDSSDVSDVEVAGFDIGDVSVRVSIEKPNPKYNDGNYDIAAYVIPKGQSASEFGTFPRSERSFASAKTYRGALSSARRVLKNELDWHTAHGKNMDSFVHRKKLY